MKKFLNNKCERCGSEVSRRNISQWIVKITDYADRLIEGLTQTDFIEKIKTAQINWIGKSQGAQVVFKVKLNREEESLEIFTTRPDTLWGATFMVLSPEHPLINKFLNSDSLNPKLKESIKEYITKSKHKSDLERTDLAKDKNRCIQRFLRHKSGK